MKRLVKGFTMIELLIVIAVLGVLAVAVLSAINPIEQINRGRDTGSRSDAEQLLTAIDRYYTATELYPWQTVVDVNEEVTPLTSIGTLIDDSAAPGVLVLTKLSTGGTAELKTSFTNRITGAVNQIQVYFTGTDGDSVYACFNPRSSSFDDAAWVRCIDIDGSGLPTDLQGAAADVCAGGVGERLSCLP